MTRSVTVVNLKDADGDIFPISIEAPRSVASNNQFFQAAVKKLEELRSLGHCTARFPMELDSIEG